MKKKVLLAIVILIAGFIIAGVAYCITYTIQRNNSTATEPGNSENNNDQTEDNNSDNNTPSASKTLIVYFSAQGHTEEVANQLAENLNADLFEIVPSEPYTSADLNYTDLIQEYHVNMTMNH